MSESLYEIEQAALLERIDEELTEFLGKAAITLPYDSEGRYLEVEDERS